MKRKYGKEHKAWRTIVLNRDKECVVCSAGPKYLNVHHIIPSIFHKWEFQANNGIVLCPHHHSLGKFSAHKNPLWFTKWLKTNRPRAYEKAMNRLWEIKDEI